MPRRQALKAMPIRAGKPSSQTIRRAPEGPRKGLHDLMSGVRGTPHNLNTVEPQHGHIQTYTLRERRLCAALGRYRFLTSAGVFITGLPQ